jgi:hypothetical protein
MSDPPLKECPQCGKEVRRLIFGGSGVIFKGSGFYVTDKGKSSGVKKTGTSASSSEGCGACPAKGDPSVCPAGGAVSSGSGADGGSKNSVEKSKPETKTA